MTDTSTDQAPPPTIIEPERAAPSLDLSRWAAPTIVEQPAPRALSSVPALAPFDESPEDFISSKTAATDSAPSPATALEPPMAFDSFLSKEESEETAPEPLLALDSMSPVKMFSLIDPNRRWVMVVAMITLGSILAASLVTSFTSVYASAAWSGWPLEIQWLPVVILDVAIVGYSWALMVRSSRLAQPRTKKQEAELKPESLARTRTVLILVTLYSTVANYLHTFSFWNGEVSSPQAIFGLAFSASIPLLALLATEELITLVFIRRRRVHAAVTQ